MLDAGILAMPLMFSLMGWLLATVVLLGTAVLGVFSTTLMAYVGLAEGTESYHMTIQKTLGSRWMTVFEGLIVFGICGGLVR